MAESNKSRPKFSPDVRETLNDPSVGSKASKSSRGRLPASRITAKEKHWKEDNKKVKPSSGESTVSVKSKGQSRLGRSPGSSSLSIAPKGYTARPIVPATKSELLPVAHAMHGEGFAPQVKKLFDPETEAALEAIRTGIYIGWRCQDFKHDCIRVGKFSKCFCGHILGEHKKYDGHSVRVPCASCECKAYAFVPSRAEEVGEFWLQRRVNYDPSTWRAKCKCKHTHEEHVPNGMKRCRVKGCPCSTFFSNFLCCACDKHWEEHATIFETAELRISRGIPYGESYLPFHELPELRNVVLTGSKDDNSLFEELTSGPYAIPNDEPTPLALRLRGEKQQGKSQLHF